MIDFRDSINEIINIKQELVYSYIYVLSWSSEIQMVYVFKLINVLLLRNFELMKKYEIKITKFLFFDTTIFCVFNQALKFKSLIYVCILFGFQIAMTVLSCESEIHI